jgi:hypothetical protein
MANEEIHPDGIDLGQGGPGVHNPTEAAHLRRQQTGSTANVKPYVEQQKDQAAAKEAARVAALTPAQKRLEELNRFNNEAGIHSKDPAKQKAAMTELRRLLVSEESPEEKTALGETTLEDHRSRFGLHVPGEHILPKMHQAEYEERFSGHEADFLAASREHGLDRGLVAELRDEGIRMAVAAQGAPVSDEAWEEFDTKFGGRLTKTQITALKSWWKTSVEQGAGS